MLLPYSLLGGSALLMIVQDVRDQTIPLSGLFVFGGASLYAYFKEPTTQGLWVAGAIFLLLIVCQGIFYLLKQTLIMGWGDIILSPFCGLWLHLQEISLYLIFTGVFALLFGLFWRYRWRLKTFPMSPALLLGLGFVFLIRCFFKGNGV